MLFVDCWSLVIVVCCCVVVLPKLNHCMVNTIQVMLLVVGVCCWRCCLVLVVGCWLWSLLYVDCWSLLFVACWCAAVL